MSHEVKQEEDGFEGILVSLLGIIIVLGGTALIYMWVSSSIPDNDITPYELEKDPLSKWIWVAFGSLFFIYGLMGTFMERIEVGWRGRSYMVTTILEGTSALVAGVGTTIGGLLLLITAAVYFYPSLVFIFHPFATLICGFASVIIGWVCGPIIRALGY